MGALYGAVMQGRNVAYDRRWLTRYRCPAPVISVGNLTSGGVGKTPLCAWLADWLLAQGRRPALISRGHGGLCRESVCVISDGEQMVMRPPEAADEAALLARHAPRAVTLTAPKRALAMAFAVEELGADVVVLDDAFQHRAAQRDLDIVLMDARQPFGNGRILPGGVLREPVSGLRRAHLGILTRADDAAAGDRAAQNIADIAPELPVLRARHQADGWRNAQGARVSAPQRAAAFCAIARPDSFQRSLQQAGVDVLSLNAFPDHHIFTQEELMELAQRAQAQGAEALACTQKDLIKIAHPERLPLPVKALAIGMAFADAAPLERMISELLTQWA
ncbi:putative lipid-A-disaccharide synthase [Magnetofaba australis IT-1]|uniref:Tetraacyldisaccharide 4'-kinase n=1 Tax=Magnetofaba australis IT-1 TaxID=1434232 RepID=A0A1Y2K770_9PROT|nr:putative lipid-A-disaccharide synthase [Magnetofaba australis IT-1]